MDPVIEYEVWVQYLDSGERRKAFADASRTTTLAAVVAMQYNEEESANARMEVRDIARRFFVVQVVTTRRELA